MNTTINNINYKFIPSKISSVNNIIKNKQIFKNDIYEKYDAIAEIQGELIICNDANMLHQLEQKIVRETYEDYLKYIQFRDIRKDRWIYNIIDGSDEQDSIIFRDDKCIVVPTYMWDGKDLDKLHVLCMPIDKSLRSIRSLNASHIELLEHMKKVTLEIIKSCYNLNENNLKMFFHYEPSTYHLHIHFVNVAHHDARSSVEYSHELNSVIFNLSICSDYYQRAILNKRV